MDVKQKINLITINNYFGQSLPTHISLQTESLKGKLQAHGYLVDFVDIQEIQKSSIKEKEYYIIGSHQNPTIKKYIDDVLAVCFQGEHEKQLIPSRLNILAHENKGVQALISKRIDARYFPSQYYYYTLTPLEKKMVVKKPDGAGSSGVELASSTHELSKIIERFSILDYSIKDILFNIKNIAKKYIFTKKYSNEFTSYHKKYSNYCLQEFYDNLSCDYKVLAFGKTLYVLKRDVRDGSFKASGSGKFSYPEKNDRLLSFCHELRVALNTPYVSLDIVSLPSGEFKCIEFQCAHFGPYTMLNSQLKYVRSNTGDWVSFPNDLTLEDAYAEAIHEYIKSLIPLNSGIAQ